jgi:hypothetical protein
MGTRLFGCAAEPRTDGGAIEKNAFGATAFQAAGVTRKHTALQQLTT